MMTEMSIDVTKVAIPVWVQVIWSESNKFKDMQLLPFNKFEKIAMNVARKNTIDQAYDKTKVNVLFSSGDEYQCRLDLAHGDTHGFKHHALGLIKYYENQDDDSAEQDYVVQAYKDNYDFLKNVVWPE